MRGDHRGENNIPAAGQLQAELAVDVIGFRVVFLLLVFATLATAILLRPAKWLSDFVKSEVTKWEAPIKASGVIVE